MMGLQDNNFRGVLLLVSGMVIPKLFQSIQKILVKMGIFPNFRGETKKSCFEGVGGVNNLNVSLHILITVKRWVQNFHRENPRSIPTSTSSRPSGLKRGFRGFVGGVFIFFCVDSPRYSKGIYSIFNYAITSHKLGLGHQFCSFFFRLVFSWNVYLFFFFCFCFFWMDSLEFQDQTKNGF